MTLHPEGNVSCKEVSAQCGEETVTYRDDAYIKTHIFPHTEINSVCPLIHGIKTSAPIRILKCNFPLL